MQAVVINTPTIRGQDTFPCLYREKRTSLVSKTNIQITDKPLLISLLWFLTVCTRDLQNLSGAGEEDDGLKHKLKSTRVIGGNSHTELISRQLNVTTILLVKRYITVLHHGKYLGIPYLYKTQFKLVFAILKIAELSRNLRCAKIA